MYLSNNALETEYLLTKISAPAAHVYRNLSKQRGNLEIGSATCCHALECHDHIARNGEEQ